MKRLKKTLEEVGIPYINLISKDLSNDTFSGEYVDLKNPERNFIFNNAKIIFSNNIYTLTCHKPLTISIGDKLL